MDTQTTPPTAESLRTMMQMAAATASAAAGDASLLTHHHPPPRHVRHHTARSSHNRRQSISQLPSLLASSPLPKGAPLPSAADGARWRRIVAVAAEISSKWVHPPESSQYETDTLHHVRAILYMNKAFITQSFVSHVSGVSQGSLSHYVRGLFRGNQQNVEDRLSQFVRKFAAGELDPFLEEARAGTRPLGRAIVLDAAAAAVAAPSTAPPAPPLPPREPPPQQDVRPPVPPPPPPQLQPPPWQQRPPPPRPPPLPQQDAPSVPETPTKGPEMSPAMTERAKRARQRQIMQQRRKRGRTPFTVMLDEMQDPTPVMAVERAFHALVMPNWTTDPTHVEPLLLPIELYVERDGKTLHMFTQWDVNERVLSPEVVAERIRRARKLPKEFAEPAALQIRRALFEAGIICPPPPSALDRENRRLIRIAVEIKEAGVVRMLRDEFEWDLGMGSANSPEVFAQHLCADAGVAQKHARVVARAIREKLCCAHAIAYADQETRKLALESLAEDDPLRKALDSVKSALQKAPEQERAARNIVEMDIEDTFVTPLLEAVVREAQNRKETRISQEKEDAERKELEHLRAKEAAEAEKRAAKLEAALKEVDEAAIELQAARGLDFRPYLAIRMGRGERPGVWTPGVFDRKRRRQTSFPMIQPSKVQTSLIQVGPRSSRRRKSSRRGEQMKEEAMLSQSEKVQTTPVKKQVKRETDLDENTAKADTRQEINHDGEKTLKLVLRVRPPYKKDGKAGSNAKKRRRR